VESRRSLSIRLLAGLAVTLSAAAVYSAYTAVQIRGLRQLQVETVDRNRMDTLLLLRIQNDLNALGLVLRDMLDAGEPYPLSAWENQLKRMRTDLEDSIARENRYAPRSRTPDQNRYLSVSMTQFADALDRIFQLARKDETEARTVIRLSLQARQAALGTAVARLLVQNNESEEAAAATTERVYARVERNLYLFLGAMLIVIGGTSAYLLRYNARVLNQVTELSKRRSELTQQLISMQENTFRSISRELHDEFGQILTAVGAMLQRAHRRADGEDTELRAELREVHEIVQATLEKVRTLSQALHPVMLDELGLEGALHAYLPVFEKRTGIAISFVKSGTSYPVDREVAVHIYRVLQETLNNVARHAKSNQALVRWRQSPTSIVVEVEDRGIGFRGRRRDGMGLVSMRERAEMMNAGIEFLEAPQGGALVRLTVPTVAQEAHAAD
jgi:signal transduction histidine kinase